MELTERERSRLRQLVAEARASAPDDGVLAGLEAKLAAGGGPMFAKYAELLEPAPETDPDILARLRDAVDSASRIGIRYTARTTGETTERVVRPFNIHFYDGREYLEAYCELRAADRVFAVGNVEAILDVGESETEATAPT
jgi:proteasome accessory factor C